jgi:AraC-like DNA-binding protein
MDTSGEFDYVRARPHPALAGLVLGYAGYREHSAVPLRRREVPSGLCPVVLSLAPPIRLHGPAGPVVRRSFLAGMHDAAVVAEFTGTQAGVQVDLSPLGVYVLLGRPLPELTNRAPALDELGVPALAALPDQLGADAGGARRLARVNAVLLRLLAASAARPDPEVTWAWRRLVHSAGSCDVGRLAAGCGWSRRHLLTRFREQVGLSPKAAARALRFRHAAELLVPSDARARPSVAEVASVAGYADQSHMVREFRALASCTPSRYVVERQGDPGFPFVQAQAAGAALPCPP